MLTIETRFRTIKSRQSDRERETDVGSGGKTTMDIVGTGKGHTEQSL